MDATEIQMYNNPSFYVLYVAWIITLSPSTGAVTSPSPPLRDTSYPSRFFLIGLEDYFIFLVLKSGASVRILECVIF